MSKNQKRLRYNNCVHIGNFKLQLYQKAVWDGQKGTVLNLQYIIVQPVNEHFSVEIYEHSSMFHYLSCFPSMQHSGTVTAIFFPLGVIIFSFVPRSIS